MKTGCWDGGGAGVPCPDSITVPSIIGTTVFGLTPYDYFQRTTQILHVDDVRKPGDARPALIDSLGPTWGQHLADVNIALGNLVGLVGSESAAYNRKH